MECVENGGGGLLLLWKYMDVVSVISSTKGHIYAGVDEPGINHWKFTE